MKTAIKSILFKFYIKFSGEIICSFGVGCQDADDTAHYFLIQISRWHNRGTELLSTAVVTWLSGNPGYECGDPEGLCDGVHNCFAALFKV